MKPNFDERDRATIHKRIDDVLDSGSWTEGPMNRAFEKEFAKLSRIYKTTAVLFSSWWGAMAAVASYLRLDHADVLVPANTFVGSVYPFLQIGCRLTFVDCNRYDLCMSFRELERRYAEGGRRHRAVLLAHIGGHLSTDSFLIRDFCRDNDLDLIEDCAHSAGAEYRDRIGGEFGVAGIYSLYATKTLTSGEGGVLLTRSRELAEYASAFRKYGKVWTAEGPVKYAPEIRGVNSQMDEFTAAVALTNLQRLPDIIARKRARAAEMDRIYQNRIELAADSFSSYYKYIVFEHIRESTGRVYDYVTPYVLGMAKPGDFPNAEWVAANHSCPPIPYVVEK